MTVTATTALGEAYERAARLIDGLGPDELGAPTPCEGWDVRATLNHTLGAAWMFTLANEGRAVGEDAGDLVGDDPGAALAEAAAANLASWRQPGAFDGDRTFPFGTFPASAAAMMNLSEVVVHTWDIAVALGVDPSIDRVPHYGSFPSTSIESRDVAIAIEQPERARRSRGATRSCRRRSSGRSRGRRCRRRWRARPRRGTRRRYVARHSSSSVPMPHSSMSSGRSGWSSASRCSTSPRPALHGA